MITTRQTRKQILEIVETYELNAIAPATHRQGIKRQRDRIPRALHKLLSDYMQRPDTALPTLKNGIVTVHTTYTFTAHRRAALNAYTLNPIKQTDLGFHIREQDAIRLLRDYASSKKPFDVD